MLEKRTGAAKECDFFEDGRERGGGRGRGGIFISTRSQQVRLAGGLRQKIDLILI